MHIIHHAIDAVLPEHAVKEQLRKKPCEGRVILVSIGKAAWRMARAAVDVLGDQVAKGVVITKYEHSQGPIKKLSIWEAGHPLPDENSLKATSEALEITENLSPRVQPFLKNRKRGFHSRILLILQIRCFAAGLILWK
jgi:glycerate 2-kinase